MGSPSIVLGETPTEELTKHLEGAAVVYSMVMPNLFTAPQHLFEQTNVQGMQQIVDACKAAHVRKLVYVSSVAVTNHLVSSVNQDETYPLPELDSYVSPYDITKRKGEDIVLAANCPTLRTCSLRAGALLVNPSDSVFGYLLSKPGTINSVKGEKMNYISGKDFCRALTLAAEKLDDAAIGGTAFFVTKSRDGDSPTPGELAQEVAKNLEWKCSVAPSEVLKAVSFVQYIRHRIDRRLEKPELGVPSYLFTRYVLYEKTFDNSRAHKLLGFTPQETWQEAVKRILDEYKSEPIKDKSTKDTEKSWLKRCQVCQ